MAHRTILYAAAALLCALLASGASAQPASYVIQADNKIEGFAVKRDGTLAGAIDEFGPPTRYRRDVSFGFHGCMLNWSSLGLQIFFYNLGGRNPCNPEYGHFLDAIVTGRQWRTASGLRIGHPARLILRFHPRAKRDPRTRNWWWLVTREWPAYGEGTYGALRAKVHRGRVSAFLVYHQAGGD